LHAAKPGGEIDLVAAISRGQQQPKQPLLVELVHHLGREAAQRLVFRRRRSQRLGNAGDALDWVGEVERGFGGGPQGGAFVVHDRYFVIPVMLWLMARGSRTGQRPASTEAKKSASAALKSPGSSRLTACPLLGSTNSAAEAQVRFKNILGSKQGQSSSPVTTSMGTFSALTCSS